MCAVTNVVSSEAFQNASSTSRNPAEVDVQSRGSLFTVLRKDAHRATDRPAKKQGRDVMLKKPSPAALLNNRTLAMQFVKEALARSAHHSTAAARQQVTQHPGGGPTSVAYSEARRPSVQEPTAPAL